MALHDSRMAVGRVGELLREQLAARTSVGTVDIGRPEEAASGGSKLNLLLYRVVPDGSMRERTLDEGQPPPLWLVLHYLLTAFDEGGDSDTSDAHELLGEAMVALEALSFLRPPADAPALRDNPEPLKLTFDDADPELLSQLMQGAEDHYRLSVAFQIRPVMLTSRRMPGYAPLVERIGPDDAGVAVIPGLGPVLTGIEPERFEAGAVIELRGHGLHGEVGRICFGETCVPAIAATGDRLRAVVPRDAGLSAGSYPMTAAGQTPGGRRLRSNAVLGRLAPVLASAAPDGPLTADSDGNLSGSLVLTGEMLGAPSDAVFVALLLDGEVVRALHGEGSTDQTQLTVALAPEQALPPDTYRLILRVNGEQARHSPEVTWS